jgi:hypothetical protein
MAFINNLESSGYEFLYEDMHAAFWLAFSTEM